MSYRHRANRPQRGRVSASHCTHGRVHFPKEKTVRRSTSFRIFLTAAMAAAPLLQANANDFIQTNQTGYFQQAAAAPKSSGERFAAQGVHVRKNLLGWEIVTYDNPPGPQGPVREELNPQGQAMRSADQSFWDNLYPIGGQGTE
jgi:hypothetical protein